MAGDINLEVVADIAKAKAGLQELSASIKQIEQNTGEVTKRTTQWDKELNKAGRTFLNLGKGSVVIAGAMAIKTVIQWTKEYEEGLASLAKQQRDVGQGALQLAQALPKALSAQTAAGLTKDIYEEGSKRQLDPDQVNKLIVPLLKKMRGRSQEDIYTAALKTMDLYAAGVSPEEAINGGRRGGVADVARAEGRAAALEKITPGLPGSRANERIRARVAYERVFPQTPDAMLAQEEASFEERRRLVQEGAGQRRGYGAGIKPGQGYGEWNQFKTETGAGMMQRSRGQEMLNQDEAEERFKQDMGQAAADLREAGRQMNSGSRW